MGRATASIEVPGLASEAEALWYDPVRWPAWVDGFGHVVELPEAMARRRARCGGTARRRAAAACVETVTAYEPRSGQTLTVEDSRLRGTQRVRSRPRPDSGQGDADARLRAQADATR